jgi:hypothetical protein
MAELVSQLDSELRIEDEDDDEEVTKDAVGAGGDGAAKKKKKKKKKKDSPAGQENGADPAVVGPPAEGGTYRGDAFGSCGA